jgi:bifunctional non-homologous end joining protein LigD
MKDVRWIKPVLVAEIEYRGWTADKLLRQTSFKGLREDKNASEIVLEESQAKPRGRQPADDIRLTHPERILWQGAGITKQGLAEFYRAIERWVLPHVANRVLSLVRCPSGAESECFYAKHAWAGLSGDIRRIDVGEDEPMMAIEGLDGLLALVQASVLEIHPWGSTIENLDRPDRMIFDLDPGEGVEWTSVITAAREVRDRLKRHRLRSFVKTTGGKGLHVVVPMAPRGSWDEVKDFARKIAEGMAADAPRLYVARMTKTLRRGRIFVDYFRNARGATAVAAYSTRARPGAPVSTPLTWEELSSAIRSDHFTLTNLQQRLEHLPEDPWRGFSSVRQALP